MDLGIDQVGPLVHPNLSPDAVAEPDDRVECGVCGRKIDLSNSYEGVCYDCYDA